MRRALIWTARIVGVGMGLIMLAVTTVFVGLNTGAGRRLVERNLPGLTGGMVTLTGLGGHFPDALRATRVTIRDARGVWLTMEGVALDWDAAALLTDRTASIQTLHIATVAVARRPESSPAKPSAPSSEPFKLPVGINVKTLRIDTVELAQPVAGVAASLGVDGKAEITADLSTVIGDFEAHRTDADSHYDVNVARVPGQQGAVITVREKSAPLLALVVGVPGLGPMSGGLSISGPTDRVKLLGDLGAGPLYATVNGSVDLDHRAADLGVKLTADAMQPMDGVAWSSVSVDARVMGTLDKPDLSGTVRIEDAQGGGASAKHIAADLTGTAGSAALKATIDGLTIPGPDPALFAASPVELSADATLSATDRPVSFTLDSSRLQVKGTASTAGNRHGRATLTVPDFSPFSKLAGTALAGHSTLTLSAEAGQEGAIAASLDGTVALTGGPSPAPALLGDAAHVAASATVNGQDVTLKSLAIDGRALRVGASGGITGKDIAADWRVTLTDLSALAPTLAGALTATGRVSGPANSLAATAHITGEIGAPGVPRGPIEADIVAAGLPAAPSGTVTAHGDLFGAPADLAASVRRDPDGTARLDLTRATWKSIFANAALSLPPGTSLPLGTAEARIDQLGDLRPLIGQTLAGALTASLKSDPGHAHLDIDTHGLALPGTGAVSRATLAADIADPLGHPLLDATFSAVGAQASGNAGGSVRIAGRGPQEALVLKVDADLRLSGQPARLASAATLNVTDKDTTVSSLQADWRGIPVRLLAPVKVAFGNGVSFDRLRLGIKQATLEVAGRITPSLDATIVAKNLTADLAAPFLPPGMGIDGTATLDAKLTGSPARPFGRVQASATGVRMRSGPGRALPPANLTARADLDGASARLDARLTAGASTALALVGRAPLDPRGALDLHATGGVDLALLNPLLTANGRRVAGQVSLDATITGTASTPRIGGTARIDRGEAQDVVQGLRLTGIGGVIEARGDTLRIARLDATAGPGSLSLTGTIGALSPGLPVDLTLTARRARPLSSDRLTADIDADITMRGQAAGVLQAAGTVKVERADIRIPERLPASIPVLNIRRPGAPVASRAPAGSTDVALALTIDAPGQIFVRGRGVDAELGGKLHIGGTAARPIPDGRFALRRGQFSLAGQTLTFTKGEVGFDAGTLTDPSLDFVASATNGGVTANLGIAGTVSAPKITLSSVPTLPQDEVLAHLLFGRSAASLSPFELAQIAATLASLTGTGPGFGDPLDRVRSGLGLDRLSVGGGAGGGTALNAGRYVAPGVYVGARQGLSGSGTQATVQVDIARGLKLEGALGAGGGSTANGTATTGSGADAGGSSVGLTYQFEY